jgi:hypothetical protein
MWCQRFYNMYYNVYTYTKKQPSKRTKHIMVPCVFINLVLLMYVFSNIITTRLIQRVRLVELELLTLKGTLSWSHHFESFTVATMIWLTVMEYLCRKRPRYVPLVVNTSRSFPHSWLIIGFVTRLTRRVSLVELTLAEHLSSSTFLVRFALLDR